MPSIIQGYEYDIFISYRQKDNKYDSWVTEFVENLKKELEATFKEDVSVYFDVNPHDGLLETHDVGESLKEKLKCLIFIPIISRTYCDPKAFAWEHEFKAFVEQASKDEFGLKVKLPNGNVANRVLPIVIYDLDKQDIKLCESVLGGVLRGVEFTYKTAGVNRPLRSNEDHPQDNINKVYYRDQINKVANTIKDIVHCLNPESKKLIKQQELEQPVIDIPEPEESLPYLSNKSVKNIKPSKSIYEKSSANKRLIISLILISFFLGILGIWGWLRSDPDLSDGISIHSSIPVESTLTDMIGQFPLFDISPDGNTIAYNSAEGIRIRTLSNFTEKTLPGTAGDGLIEFSPDGQFLAFSSSGGIKKVSISGSPMSVIHPINGLCLFWGLDGNIYFSRGLGTEGVWRVSANGGEPERLTFVADSLGENAHTWPQLLPDSKTLLYTSLGPSGGSIDSKIVIEQLDTKERKILVNNAIFGRYLSNGNILYSNNEGNIFILPFNLRKKEITGDPIAVLSGVNTSTWSGAAFISVSENGNLIYLPRFSKPILIPEILDRKGEAILADSIPMKTLELMGHGWFGTKISPTGEYMAVTGRSFGSADIWLLNLKSKNAERISFETSEDEFAAWSPDGKYLAYTASMTGKYEILIQDLNIRGNPEHVLTWPRHGHISDWSSDGNWFAFSDFSANNNRDVYIISVSSGEVIPVATTQASETGGQFSPDSKWLTYISNQSGSLETYIVSVPELQNKRQFLTNATNLHWDRNGKMIYYKNGEDIFAQEIDIGINDIKKGSPVRLFQSNLEEFGVSPDGQKFYFLKTNPEVLQPQLLLITNWFKELEAQNVKQ